MNINIEQVTKKDLLAHGRKHILQALHENFGYDFEGDYKIYHITGRFTAKSLNKYAENDYFTVLTHGNYLNHNILYAVGCDGEKFDIHITSNYSRLESYDWYYTKMDFDEERKNPYSDAYMVTQRDRKYGYKNPRFDNCERFKLQKEHAPIPYGFNGRPCHDRYLYHAPFDKSGYPVDLYRERLQDKADKIREEKEKAEYLKTDNSDKVATLERLINAYKAKLAEQLIAIKTVDDVYAVDRLLGFSGLHSIIEDFIDFKRNTEEKSFNSIKASDALYDRIASRIYKFI